MISQPINRWTSKSSSHALSLSLSLFYLFLERIPRPSLFRLVSKKSTRMLVSGRQSVDYYSPCRSSNRKRLDRLHRHLPSTRWSAATRSAAVAESDSWDGQCRFRVSESNRCSCGGTRDSSEMMMMMMLAGGGRRPPKSSRGSCGVRSVGSMLEMSPASPSPVLSPVCSISCTPASDLVASHSLVSTADAQPSSSVTFNQSSIIKSSDGKKSTSQEEAIGEDIANAERRKPTSAPHNLIFQPIVDSTSPIRKMREGKGSLKQNPTPKCSSLMGGSLRSTGLRFSCEPSSSLDTNNHDENGRLPAIREEQDMGCKKSRFPTGSSRLSSDDEYYTLSSEDDHGYENTDIDSVIDDRLGAAAKTSTSRSFMSKKKRDELESKFIAWKEARTLKLMNQLKQEEVAIEEWERKKTREAKMEMKVVEMRLEKKRSKAMEKMQKRLRRAHKSAEKKKLKERAATDKKIRRISKEYEKIARTGKLPWATVLC